MSRVLFVGGGSIGHIAPCVAVWRALQKLEPGAAAHFLCSTREEDAAFLQKEEIPHTPFGPRSLRLFALPGLFLRARRWLTDWKPDAVFTKGGGVTIPVGLAAWTLRIPLLVHESDAVAGRGTKLLSLFAREVCYGFPQKVTSYELRVTGEDQTTRNPQLVTRNSFIGNPLRDDATGGSRTEGLRLTGLPGKKPVLLVVGGSQGATALNDVIIRRLDELLGHCEIAHITGKEKEGAAPRDGYWHAPFAHEELKHLYALADLALSRAGAGSIGELALNGIPSILVPLEGLANNHQVRNAEAAAKSGGCMHLAQDDLQEKLVPLVAHLAGSASERERMSTKMRSLANPQAAGRLARLLLELGQAKK